MAKKLKILKDFTYFSLIKEAIFSTSNLEASVKDIYGYLMMKYPGLFRLSNSFTWKSGIRQVLTRYPEFIKIRKIEGTKNYLWSYRPIEEIERMEDTIKMLLKKKEDVLGIWEVMNIEGTMKKQPTVFKPNEDESKSMDNKIHGDNTNVKDKTIENNDAFEMDRIFDYL